MAASVGETKDADDGYGAFLDFLQSCGSASTKDLKKDELATEQSGNDKALQSKRKPTQKKSHSKEDKTQPQTKNKSENEPTGTEKDDAGDAGGFLEFLSFVYDVPLGREEPKEEEVRDTALKETGLEKEDEEAWVPIATQPSENEQPKEETIVAASKRIMKEIVANEEDAIRQKNKFVLMELEMLFSLAGDDKDTGGANVARIFGCLKDDSTKDKLFVD